MSTEQDKDALSLKRSKGGDSVLEGLGGPGGLLGSPDKKKRKSNNQASTFAPLSEYAPPPNPGADHLVASNPFDDSYSIPSYKPLFPSTNSNPYLGPSTYSVYGPPRMSPRMPGPYQMRGQLQPFPQNQMGLGLGRGPGFNYGHQEAPSYGSQPVFSGNISSPLQYRPGLGLLNNVNRGTNLSPGFGPEGNIFGRGNLGAPLVKHDMSTSLNKSSPPRKQTQGSEDYDRGASELKPKNRGQEETPPTTLNKLNGVMAGEATGKVSPPPEQKSKRSRRSSSSGSKSVPPGRLSRPPAEPVYPCGICLNEVNDDQEAIMCEASCQKWFHRVCTGMTETAYNLLTAEALAVWGCDACMEDKGAPLTQTREPNTVSSEG